MTPARDIALARTREALRGELTKLGEGGTRIGLVPTMGALHEGHLSLIDRARELTDAVVVSIFVNPLQFGPGEDFDAYPRSLERDLELAAERGARLVFAPDEATMYAGRGPPIEIDPGPLGNRLCGVFRPGHFRGVLTVVAKLFGLIRPEVAVFGRKDFQQGVLIRRMVDDLELGVTVEIAPLVREVDGLALSSRNAYLSRSERQDALGLWHALEAALDLFASGETRTTLMLERAREIAAASGSLRLQYAELVDPETLEPVREASDASVLLVAGLCRETRLIDNIVLGQGRSDPRVSAALSGRPGA